MDYNELLTLSTDVGYRLLESGAEIYRVEDSIRRILHAYGMKSAEVFAIPNCITVSMITPEGQASTRVRRMPSHDTDLEQLELCNALCRTLCRDTPELPAARALLDGVTDQRRSYSLPMRLLGYCLATSAFTLFFGGSWADGLCGGLCGLVICLCVTLLSHLNTGVFFKCVVAAAISALLALGLTRMGVGSDLDVITIGAFMVLVPGVALTNALREMMAGDMISGISRLAEALLIATAIALGTGVAMTLANHL